MSYEVSLLAAAMVLLTAPLVFVDFLKRFVLKPGRRAWAAWAEVRGGSFREEVPGFYGHVSWPRPEGELVLAEGLGLAGWESLLRRTCAIGAGVGAGDRARLESEARPRVAEFRERWERGRAALRVRSRACDLVLSGSVAEDENGDMILAEAEALLEDVVRAASAARGEGA